MAAVTNTTNSTENAKGAASLLALGAALGPAIEAQGTAERGQDADVIDATYKTVSAIVRQILVNGPASNLAELMVKVRAFEWCRKGEPSPDCYVLGDEDDQTTDRQLAGSIIRDLSAGCISASEREATSVTVLPDFTKMSYGELYTMYETFWAMRNLLEPLESLGGRSLDIPGYSEFIGHWTGVVFSIAASVGKYAATCGRPDLSPLRARYIVDVAEGEVDVVGDGVPEHVQRYQPHMKAA